MVHFNAAFPAKFTHKGEKKKKKLKLNHTGRAKW